MKRPTVLVVSRRTTRKSRLVDYVGELHLELLIRLGLLPVIVPVVKGTLGCLVQYTQQMHGLLLVEGDDIEPARYAARKANLKYVEGTHPRKDAIELRLLHEALRRQLPIFGICRGSQLLNVACGGTLYGDVQREKRSPLIHISHDHYDTYRHPVSIIPKTPLASWYGRKRINVNSYHHQGVRSLAHNFRAMAHAPDGLTEAFYAPESVFVVGLQFHPERMLNEYAGSLKVWEAFADAVHRNHRDSV